MNSKVEFLRKKGYPLRILGNDGFPAALVGIQHLVGGDYTGVYRYPGGDTVHDLDEIQRLVNVGYFAIIEK